MKGGGMPPEDRNLEDPEILKKIQEAETKIEWMTVQAMAEAQRIVDQARENAQGLLRRKEKELEEASTRLLQEGIEEAEREAAALTGKAKQEAGALKEHAVGRADEVADLVLQRVFPDLPGGDPA
jgi:vacuolar-type H+-ATPase subunit H